MKKIICCFKLSHDLSFIKNKYTFLLIILTIIVIILTLTSKKPVEEINLFLATLVAAWAGGAAAFMT
jgi:hypothetical protein